MVNSYWSLIPPLVAIIMVLLTRRVLVSLGAGIVAAALFIASFQLGESAKLIGNGFKGVFVEDGGLNTGNVFILIFILMLGILTALVNMMGGTRAFGDYMIKHVKTRAGAQIMTMIFGVILFIDDYFNSLTVGQIAMPVTDKHKVSRAKLSYIVDSTSAPICVVTPISSWGAYIIGILGTIMATHSIVEYSAFVAFIKLIPLNFYAWSALGVILVIILRKAEFGPMKKHEEHAQKTGEVLLENKPEEKKEEEELPVSGAGTLLDLVLPIAVLLFATIGAIIWTGYNAAEGDKAIMDIFGEADVSLSLLIGGAISLIVTFIMFSRHMLRDKLTGKSFSSGVFSGIMSMLPVFFILIFAWVIVDLIETLETGTFIGDIVQNSNISLAYLPVIVFAMAGFIAFATGSSWGSFGLLLPIAGQIAASTDINLLLPVLGAVLAGSVFGDHASPISDTTILSAAGSKVSVVDHVTTQLPYALTAALISGLSYLVLGLTGNIWIGIASLVILLIALFFIIPKSKIPEETTGV